MDNGQRGITYRGNSAQISFTFNGIRCRELLPVPPTKAAKKEIELKRQSILYEIKTGTFDYLRIFVRQAKVKGQIKGTKTSSGTREIMLQPQAKEALTNQYAYTGKISEIVFHDSRNNQSWRNDQTIRKVVWIFALERAGLKYRNPYQTRHTFASMLLSKGENPLWVANQMGHKDWGQIRKVYGRWIPQEKR